MDLIKTRIEVNNAVFSLPYHVARERGIFTAEGLDVTLVPAGSGRDRDKEVPDKPIEDHTQVKSYGWHEGIEKGEFSMADVITGSGSFSVEKSTVQVTTPQLTDARLLKFTLSGLTVSTGFGLAISVQELIVATLQPSATAVAAGDTRKWSAISITDAGGSLNLGGVISATVEHLDVKVNSASGALSGVNATPIDYVPTSLVPTRA